MTRASSGLSDQPDARIEAREKERPEWRPWLRLLRVTAGALHGAWCVIDEEAAASPPAPLLHDRTLRVEGRRLAELLMSLLAAAAEPGAGAGAPGKVEPSLAIALFGAAIRREDERLTGIAVRLGVPVDVLGSVADFLVRPCLNDAAGRLAHLIPPHWPHGHCPVCGGGALLAELRGIDRARLLRCGRCGSAWSMPWLRCAHCGEADHEKLGTLVPEENGERMKIEVCASCGGYLKSIATLGTSSLVDLLLTDLETVDLDLAALDRGYWRPSSGGRPPGVLVTGRETDAESPA